MISKIQHSKHGAQIVKKSEVVLSVLGKCGKIKHCQYKMGTDMCKKDIFTHNSIHLLLNSAVFILKK